MELEGLEEYNQKNVSLLLNSPKFCIKGKIIYIRDTFTRVIDKFGYHSNIDNKNIVVISEEESTCRQ